MRTVKSERGGSPVRWQATVVQARSLVRRHSAGTLLGRRSGQELSARDLTDAS